MEGAAQLSGGCVLAQRRVRAYLSGGCGVAQWRVRRNSAEGAAKLSGVCDVGLWRVWNGSVLGCDVAQSRARRGSWRVRRNLLLGCGEAQWLVRRAAVRWPRVPNSDTSPHGQSRRDEDIVKVGLNDYRGRILGRNRDKSLKSCPPYYSQSPIAKEG